MKKILFTLMLFVATISVAFAQEPAPSPTKAFVGQFFMRISGGDTSIYVYKGIHDGWTKLAKSKDVPVYTGSNGIILTGKNFTLDTTFVISKFLNVNTTSSQTVKGGVTFSSATTFTNGFNALQSIGVARGGDWYGNLQIRADGVQGFGYISFLNNYSAAGTYFMQNDQVNPGVGTPSLTIGTSGLGGIKIKGDNIYDSHGLIFLKSGTGGAFSVDSLNHQAASYYLNRANHTGTQAESTVTNLVTDLAGKQATLVSGTNIKTVNSTTLLGSGNLAITTANTDTTSTGFRTAANSLSLASLQTKLNSYLLTATAASTYQPIATANNGVVKTGNNFSSDTTYNRTVLNSYSLAGLQTKLNNYLLSSTASTTYTPLTRTLTAGTGILTIGDLSVNRTISTDTTILRTVANSYTLASLQTKLNGYVPTSRTLTINGTLFDLSANRSFSVGTVTSLATGYGLSGGTVTTTGTLLADTTTTTGLVSKSRLATNLGGYVPGTRTVAGFPLSSNVTLGTLTISTGLTGTSYNPSGATTIKADTSVLQTVLNFFPKGDTRYAKITSLPAGANPTASIGVTATNGVATTFMRSDAAPKADTTALRTVANSYTLATLQTKLNTYLLSSTASSTYQPIGTYLTPSSTNVVTNKDLTSGTNTFPTFNQNTTGQAGSVANSLTNGLGVVTLTYNGSSAKTVVVDTTVIKSKAGLLIDYNNLSGRITTSATNITTLQNRNISTGLGLSGGGNLTADRTLIADTTVLKSKAGSLTDYNNLSGRITTNATNIALKANIASPSFTGTPLFGVSAFTVSNGFLGLLTTAPTHALTIGSGGASALYKTTDQTVNYERFNTYWSGTQLVMETQNGGTGVQRGIFLNGATITMAIGGNSKAIFQPDNITGFFNINANLTNPNTSSFGISSVVNNSSGVGYGQSIVPTINQTATASYTGLWISPFFSTVGSGSKLLIDAGTNTSGGGAGTHTSKFSVDNSGNMVLVGHATLEGVTSTGATGTGNIVYSASPTLTGSPIAPTQSALDNSTKIATTAYADGAVTNATQYFQSGMLTGLGTLASPFGIAGNYITPSMLYSTSGTPGSTTVYYGDGHWGTVSGGSGTPANPTAVIGLTAINGTATTYMRSDAAPALDVTIAPTMTGNWIFSPTNSASSGTTYGLQLNATNTGTGTNGFTAFGLNLINTTNGSNPTYIANWKVGGTTKLSVDLFGAISSSGGGSFQSLLSVFLFQNTATSVDGFALNNSAVADATHLALFSPATHYHYSVWNTSGTPAANYLDFKVEGRSVSGTTPTGTIYWSSSLGTSSTTPSYVDRMSLDNSGNLNLLTGGITVSGHTTFEGVTSTGATGSGKLVYDTSPTLTGTPLAPTATAGTNTTQIATTAFVTTAVAGASGGTGANPTGVIGLTAVNGVATTFMRSDAAPALSQSIAPTMTGLWTFAVTNTLSSGVGYGTQFTNVVNQTSTAGFTDLLINRTTNTPGSGAQNFVDFQVAGSSKFNVVSDGSVGSKGGATFQANIGAFEFLGTSGTSTSGFTATNSANASAAQPNLYAPGFKSHSTVWNTNTLAVNYVDWNFESRGVSGTTPSAVFNFAGSVGTSSTTPTYVNLMTLDALTGNLSLLTGSLTAKHFIGNSSTPTIAAGTGAGTSPTVTVPSGNDAAMKVSVVTGTTPTGSNATVATITFNSAYGVAPKVILTPVNANAAALTGATMPYIDDASTTTTSFVIKSGSTALTASTTYLFYAHVIQ